MDFSDYYHEVETKTLQELSLEELAFIHLNGREFTSIKDGYIISGLPLVLKEIRYANWRKGSQNFLPLAATFTVLDQIGFSYSRSDMLPYSNSNASSIKKSLYYFCGFEENDQDTKALYALRNSFLHTASLLSKGRNKNDASFLFSFSKNSTVMIDYPLVSWDGNFDTLNPEDMTTLINTNLVLNMVENAVIKALELLYSDRLVITMDGGEEEFFYRYLKYKRG